jgi:hypothetical protein
VWSVYAALTSSSVVGSTSRVSHPAQALAFELAKPVAVLGVGEVVEDGPDEREAAGLAGEAADHLGAAFDLGERPFRAGWSSADLRRIIRVAFRPGRRLGGAGAPAG